MKADVAVVGAGALGLAVALHCGLRGRSVVILDRRTPGSQASGRAAGLFKSVQGDEIRTFLARRSIGLVQTFASWAGVPLDVASSGSLLVARGDGHKKLLAAELAQSLGWGVTWPRSARRRRPSAPAATTSRPGRKMWSGARRTCTSKNPGP